MGTSDKEDYVKCKNCNVELLEEEAHYVRAKPYCEKCYREEEIYYEGYDEDYEDNDDDEDDDDDDDDDD